jgi:hypothetical protein
MRHPSRAAKAALRPAFSALVGLICSLLVSAPSQPTNTYTQRHALLRLERSPTSMRARPRLVSPEGLLRRKRSWALPRAILLYAANEEQLRRKRDLASLRAMPFYGENEIRPRRERDSSLSSTERTISASKGRFCLSGSAATAWVKASRGAKERSFCAGRGGACFGARRFGEKARRYLCCGVVVFALGRGVA